MNDEKGFTLNTNDYNVAKMAIALELTKFIRRVDESEIPASRVVDLYNLVYRTMGSDSPIDQESFKKLHDKQ